MKEAMTKLTLVSKADEVMVAQELGDTILRAGVLAGVGFPYECNVGSCGTCKYELLDGEVEVIGPQPALSEKDIKRGRWLACQTRATQACRLKVRLLEKYRPTILPRKFSAQLVETAQITHDIREFRFRAPSPAEFLPGQYVRMRVPGVEGIRAYSMANLANEDGDWVFQIRLAPGGQATGALFGASHGLKVEIDGPYGFANLKENSPRNIVCIAGGSGLAPMLSIARGADSAGMLKSRQLFFFYGGRTKQDLCGEKQLQELACYSENLKYFGAASDEDVGTCQKKYVHQMVAEELSEHDRFEYYLAGPAVMVDATLRMLVVENAVPQEQIHYDRFL